VPQCPNGWAIVDTLATPTTGTFQIACSPQPKQWLFTADVMLVGDTQPMITLFVDGRSEGIVVDGEHKHITGSIVTLQINIVFPTPPDLNNYVMTLDYWLQTQV